MSRGHRDESHVAFAMEVRRLELRYGLYIHVSPRWTFVSRSRPSPNRSVFSAIAVPEHSAALEKEVDAEPRPRVRPS
jgi:hypothetical protein